MEFPKSYLKGLKDRIRENFNGRYNHYMGVEGAKRLSEDLGATLLLSQADEVEYIVEHSYDILFRELYGSDVNLSKEEWQNMINESSGLSKDVLHVKQKDKER